MKFYHKAGLAIALFVFLFTESVLAYGTNITINDNRDRTTVGKGIGQEDQETEPGMIQNQSWDLEAFYKDGNRLSVVGGFDFIRGVSGYSRYQSGDIFIDTNGNAQYGNGADNSVLNYGYDFVIDLNLDGANNSSLDYQVYALDQSSVLVDVLEHYNDPESNPWRYDADASQAMALTGGVISYEAGLTDEEAGGLLGGDHFAISGIDLSFLAAMGIDDELIFHFTMGCGNDNLMGKGKVNAPVPEPATMLLLGTGLFGLVGMGRKKFQ